MTSSLTLKLTPEIRLALDNLLTVAERLEDYARIIDHFTDELFGDADEFRLTVYDPLRDKRSVTTGQRDTFTLDLRDVDPIFDVIKGVADGWVGGTPWKAMSPAERVAVDRFLETLRQR